MAGVEQTPTEIAQELLALFGDEPPCMMMAAMGCPKPGTWLIEFEHMGADCGQFIPNPAPFCDEHKSLLVMVNNRFLLALANQSPAPCGVCNVEMKISNIMKVGS